MILASSLHVASIPTYTKMNDLLTLNDLEWLFHDKMRFRPAVLESECLNVRNSTVFCALHDQLASLGRHAQLTRCFSAVAELLLHLYTGRIVRLRWNKNCTHARTFI